MRSVAAAIFALVMKFGGIGLLVIGILDSSFLFAPWGNDLLIIALVARHRDVVTMLYYAAMSTVGSVLGCLLLDVTLRPLGAKGLERHLSPRRIKRVEDKMTHNGGRALAIASLVPPPFPFTIFVMGAAALQYPRKRMLAVIAVTRMIRFTIFGFLGIAYGERILRWSRNATVQAVLFGLVAVCVVGSIVSVVTWIKRSRKAPGPQPENLGAPAHTEAR